MSYDLSRFGIAETLTCGLNLRRVADGHPTIESASRAVCSYFYDELLASGGSRACVLVRFYITATFGTLSTNDRQFATVMLSSTVKPSPDMKCLTLLGTRGDVAAWNSRGESRAHRVIPLPSAEVIQHAPMISQLFSQMGVELTELAKPSASVILNLEKHLYNVFHVETALNSPYIPAQQDFVLRYGVQSVLGFGGMLPYGEHFAVIIFSRVGISRDVATRFRSLALDVRSKLLRFDRLSVFDRDAPADSP